MFGNIADQYGSTPVTVIRVEAEIDAHPHRLDYDNGRELGQPAADQVIY
ncbi:MAG: hypothetical protein R3300_20485 [Candidatus Promineifilaceae bacterium]|nr:hypothetical protein [Candidatus Promineifilaceae bacterium]